MNSRTFQSTSSAGLNYDLVPMKLWSKAKRLGIWDPMAIDFTQDRKDWLELNELEQTVILHLTSQFLGGEESVTQELLPLISAIRKTGCLEEEMYLTSFLWEEAKHVEALRYFFDTVACTNDDLSHFHGENYCRLFHEELPGALDALEHDRSPVALARASVTYNMIVEGVLAETGYHAYAKMLADNDIMPGMQQMAANLKQDESRHLAFGVYLLSRLTAEYGDEVWFAIEARMNELLPIALGMINETLGAYEELPFGLVEDDFVEFGTSQFQKRYMRVAKAREQTLEEVMGLSAVAAD